LATGARQFVVHEAFVMMDLGVVDLVEVDAQDDVGVHRIGALAGR
jgi:hypothetical protein